MSAVDQAVRENPRVAEIFRVSAPPVALRLPNRQRGEPLDGVDDVHLHPSLRVRHGSRLQVAF